MHSQGTCCQQTKKAQIRREYDLFFKKNGYFPESNFSEALARTGDKEVNFFAVFVGVDVCCIGLPRRHPSRGADIAQNLLEHTSGNAPKAGHLHSTQSSRILNTSQRTSDLWEGAHLGYYQISNGKSHYMLA